MTRADPAIFPGRIGSGWPASFHACTASEDSRTISMPPLVGLLYFAVGEEKCVVDFQVRVVVQPCFLGE
jgi:hypothetical protein